MVYVCDFGLLWPNTEMDQAGFLVVLSSHSAATLYYIVYKKWQPFYFLITLVKNEPILVILVHIIKKKLHIYSFELVHQAWKNIATLPWEIWKSNCWM